VSASTPTAGNRKKKFESSQNKILEYCLVTDGRTADIAAFWDDTVQFGRWTPHCQRYGTEGWEMAGRGGVEKQMRTVVADKRENSGRRDSPNRQPWKRQEKEVTTVHFYADEGSSIHRRNAESHLPEHTM
jgi:hypothetical protein